MLGRALESYLKDHSLDYVGLDYPAIDIRDSGSLSLLRETAGITNIINCIAFTNVNRAEQEPGLCAAINVSFVKLLADLCEQKGAALCHISSAYVFDGRKKAPYTEADTPNPVNFYGISKLASDLIVQTYVEHGLIIRTSDLYGPVGIGKRSISERFVEMITRNEDLYVVENEKTSPTYTITLAAQIMRLILNNRKGIFNATALGECNWGEFARHLKAKFSNSTSKIIPVKSDYFAGASKPLNAVLSKDKLIREGLCMMQSWQDDLDEYVSKLTKTTSI